MSDISAISADAYLMTEGRAVVQQAAKRIALSSARFSSEALAIEAAQSVGLDASKVQMDAGATDSRLDDTYQLDIDVSGEILRIKAAQHQVKLGIQLHQTNQTLNENIQGLLR